MMAARLAALLLATHADIDEARRPAHSPDQRMRGRESAPGYQFERRYWILTILQQGTGSWG
jgi:mannose/cellobiose epimerase-like protein (N-acyl-D-glucosamine 2-epimerase family)